MCLYGAKEMLVAGISWRGPGNFCSLSAGCVASIPHALTARLCSIKHGQ